MGNCFSFCTLFFADLVDTHVDEERDDGDGCGEVGEDAQKDGIKQCVFVACLTL